MSDRSSPADSRIVPRQPIDRLTRPLTRFMHVETTSGIVLVLATLTAIVAANSPAAEAYAAIWKTHVELAVGSHVFEHSLKHLINDGLMAVFFFVIGLEVKREIVLGELRDFRVAALPIAAAVGGMVLPAALFLLIVGDGPEQRAWGIPMATDIAFVVGCMALLGSRIPASLRVILLSLAIADDIGAILVIALGYTKGLQLRWLLVGCIGIGLVWILARLGVRRFLPYILLGVIIWFGFHESGIHATIAGVILGMMTPARNYIPPENLAFVIEHARQLFEGESSPWKGARASQLRQFRWVTRETISPLEYLEALLHPWVAFVIMPLFALANAGVPIELSALQSSTSIAVAVGLVIGKPVGIYLAARLAVLLRMAKAPDCGWGLLFAGGCLAGIGFTMSLFVAELALEGAALTNAKLGVLAGSVASALLGITLILLKQPKADEPATV